jgi:hypothetical protein
MKWKYMAADPKATCFYDVWHAIDTGTLHKYCVVLRHGRYDAEKNFKIIGEFAELEPAQRCVEASAARARTVRSSRRLATLMKPK